MTITPGNIIQPIDNLTTNGNLKETEHRRLQVARQPSLLNSKLVMAKMM